MVSAPSAGSSVTPLGGSSGGVLPPSTGQNTNVNPLDYLDGHGGCKTSKIGTPKGTGCNPSSLQHKADQLRQQIENATDMQTKAALAFELAKVEARLTDLKYYWSTGVSALTAIETIIKTDTYKNMSVEKKLDLWNDINYKLSIGKLGGPGLKKMAQGFVDRDRAQQRRTKNFFSSGAGLTAAAYGVQAADSGFSSVSGLTTFVSVGQWRSLVASAQAGSKTAIQIYNRLSNAYEVIESTDEGIKFGVKGLRLLTEPFDYVFIGGFKLLISVLGVLGLVVSISQLTFTVIDICSTGGTISCNGLGSRLGGTAIQIAHTGVDIAGGFGAGYAGAQLGVTIGGPIGFGVGLAVGVILFFAVDIATNKTFNEGLMPLIGCKM